MSARCSFGNPRCQVCPPVPTCACGHVADMHAAGCGLCRCEWYRPIFTPPPATPTEENEE